MILLEPGLITTEFGEAATASMADTTIAGDDPYATFNTTVGAVTKGAYEGPMRLLGGGPDRVAKTIERAIKRRNPPARIMITPSAKLTIAMRRLLPDRAVGRDDAPAVPAAALGGDASGARPGTRAADLRSPARSRRRSSRSRRSVCSSPTNSAIVRWPMPAHDADERLDDELVVREPGSAADEVAVDLQVAERQVLEVVKGAEAGAEVVERDGAAERAATPAQKSRARRMSEIDGGLGDLDDQARRVGAVAGQAALRCARACRGR